MSRIRAGLTGLGLVFVFTLAASVLFMPASVEAPSAATAKADPLAHLGVVPGPEKSPEPLNTPPLNTPVPEPVVAPVLPPERPVAAVPDAALSEVERNTGGRVRA